MEYIVENVIISQNKHWQKPYQSLYDREVFTNLVKNLRTKHIQILQGIRRSGKSTLFKLLINHLSKKNDPKKILYINLDDPFFIKYSNDPTIFYTIIQTAKKLTNQDILYLFLDEVQAISGWESFVKSVYDSEEFKKIFITGSNSSLLNGDFASLLTGRYLKIEVYPLSFREILQINQINNLLTLHKSLPKVLNIVDNMLRYGSFVEVFEAEFELKREILKTYYETILLKDCISNNQVRDIKSFKELSFYLLTNIASLYSYSSLSKILKINDKSVKEYIGYLENSFLFNELKIYSYSLKEQYNNKKKIYVIDNGFLELGFSFSSNKGKLFENLVFSELLKNGYELYFYNKTSECDFIVKKDNDILAIQVCYEINEQNYKREFKGFLKLPFKVSKKIVLTYNQNAKNLRFNIPNGIEVISFWEYFIDK